MRIGWILVASALQLGCDSCVQEEAVMQELTPSMIEGGAESAEAVAEAWFGAIGSGDEGGLEALILSTEQLDLVVDCGDEDQRSRLAQSQDELRSELSVEVDRISTELAEQGARIELDQARANSSTPLEAGDSLWDCELLRPVIRHQIRSFSDRMDAQGERRRELRLTAALEVDGRWFLTGVPGAVTSGEGRPKAASPVKAPPVGPIIKGRAPIIVKPPSTRPTGPPQGPDSSRTVPAP